MSTGLTSRGIEPAWGRQAERALPWLFTSLGFFLPMAPAPVSVLLAILIVFAVVLAPRLLALEPWREPTVIIGLLLLAWIAGHTLWTSGFDVREAVPAVNRYHELLLPLVLIPLFRLAGRPDAFLRGLVAGALVWAALHWAALAHEPLAAYLAKRRISAGWTMAVTAFLLLVHAPVARRPSLYRLAAAALSVTVVFAISGRTGHVVLLALLALAAGLLARRGRDLAVVVVAALAIGVVALSSTRLQDRLAETVSGSARLDRPVTNSTEIRLQLALTARDLVLAHGWTGVGHTHFAERHAESTTARLLADPNGAAHLKEWWVHIDNPHNEYVLQVVGAGATALALFLGWLAAPLLRSGPVHMRRSIIGLILAFAIGCLFNSLLRDFIEGHFFTVILAWLLAQADVRSDPGR